MKNCKGRRESEKRKEVAVVFNSLGAERKEKREK